MKDIGLKLLDDILENSSAGIAAYESPATQKVSSSYSMLGQRYGCDNIKDHRRKSRCMLKGKLLELKKQLAMCQDVKCKQEAMIKIKKWSIHYREEMRNSAYKSESFQPIDEQIQKPLNILKNKNTNMRTTSKEGQSTIKKEIMDEYDKCKDYISKHCNKSNPREKSICSNRMYMNSIKKIQNLKKECERSQFHKTRCIKSCDAAIKYLSEKIKK